MTPVRRPRLFHDHKAPLAAFVLVVLTSMFMMVHIARSEAAPSWLRQGVSTVAAGPVLVQRVISGDLVEPQREPAEPPADLAVAVPPVEAPSASSDPRTPSASSTHAPSSGANQEPVRTPTTSATSATTLTRPAPSSRARPPRRPRPPTTPASGGRGDHGLVWGHDDDSDQGRLELRPVGVRRQLR